MFVGTLRFWAYGWIEELYLSPKFHFSYLGFEWVQPWPGQWLYLHFGLMAASAFALMLGAFTRLSAALFFLSFSYAELLEKAAYLNHYYLVSLMAALLVFVPGNEVGSVDSWRCRTKGGAMPPTRRLDYVLLQGQVAVVYFFAGFAKLNADWLLRAEPLRTWLSVRQDLPLVGPLFAAPATAFAMSYWGAVFDLTVVGWLLWKRSRPWAYGLLIAFHLSVWLLFPIGMFSWVMITVASLFLAPNWPRLLWRSRQRRREASSPLSDTTLAGRAVPGWQTIAALMYLSVQAVVPLRFLLYPDNVNWHEQGFRFAWRVMLVEKSGQVEFIVTTSGGKRYVVYPRVDLTPLQYTMMRTQPDMIHEYALHLKSQYEKRTDQEVEVRVNAWVSFNGRRSQRLIDPDVDLGSYRRSLRPQPWILPLKGSKSVDAPS